MKGDLVLAYYSYEGIKACPFCGGRAHMNGISVFWVSCEDCGCEMWTETTPEAAIEKWNVRVDTAGGVVEEEEVVVQEDVDAGPGEDGIEDNMEENGDDVHDEELH